MREWRGPYVRVEGKPHLIRYGRHWMCWPHIVNWDWGRGSTPLEAYREAYPHG